jgi:hypothetical protein
MTIRLRSLLAVVGASLCLAACGGGTTTVAPRPNPNPGPPGPAGSLSLSSSQLNFASAASPAQTVTATTTIASPLPTFNSVNCGSVATINSTGTGGAIAYTVTPNGNGVCAVVITIKNVSATLTITVGGASGLVTVDNSAVTVSVGGAGSFSATAGSGTWTIDQASCAGIATFSTTSTGDSVTYNISPVAAGTCTATAIDTAGHALVLQPIVVTSGNVASTLQLTPPALAFSVANVLAHPPGSQTFTLTISGTAGLGALTLDESSCWNGASSGSPRIAYATLNGAAPGATVTPPATFTVTLFTPAQGGQLGSCAINFVSGGVVYGSEAISVGP